MSKLARRNPRALRGRCSAAMTEPITLYYNPLSRARIAHWMLEEVGVDYRLVTLDFERGEHKSAAYLALNPMGKVPCIVDRGLVVTEAAAICAYLADKFPGAGLAPSIEHPARGTYLRWLFFGAGCLEPALVDKLLGRPLPTIAGALGYGTYADTLSTLERALAPGPFLLGERFSAADVYIASQLEWGAMTGGLEARDTFSAYIARCAQRSAYARYSERAREIALQLRARGTAGNVDGTAANADELGVAASGEAPSGDARSTEARPKEPPRSEEPPGATR